jgi:hypothetical protein
MEQKRAMVQVGCRVLNGVVIRRTKQGFDDGTGFKPIVHDGPGVRLNGPPGANAGVGNSDGLGSEPGITDVDAEWFAAWFEQHKASPMVTEGHVFQVRAHPRAAPATGEVYASGEWDGPLPEHIAGERPVKS